MPNGIIMPLYKIRKSNLRRDGFTIIEFMMSMMISFFVLAMILSVAIKKNHYTNDMASPSGEWTFPFDDCTAANRDQFNDRNIFVFVSSECAFDAAQDGTTANTAYCVVNQNSTNRDPLDPNRNEFVTIHLIGGGGGGGAHLAGTPGESKTLYLPAMNGLYYFHIGQGGENNTNGQDTVLFWLPNATNPDTFKDLLGDNGAAGNNWYELARARGGVTTNEDFPEGLDIDATSPEADEYTQAKQSAFSQTCGMSGAANEAGLYGQIKILW